ncbi:hypothetical protein NE237_024921 [Protea cynaroides]|uniref:Uncharacterized protein n=1 Tax=Protea cynaroides TaxID=273540 RepID=A0A9Q0H222_9MAGN|nr:hypothetical protein NE237_024921 [Protea cynaroides]
MESHSLIEDLIATRDVSQVRLMYACKRFIEEAVNHFGKVFWSFCGFEVVDAFLLPPPAKGLEWMDELDGMNRGHNERMPIMTFPAEEADDGIEKRVVVAVRAEAYYSHQSYGEELWRSNKERVL